MTAPFSLDEIEAKPERVRRNHFPTQKQNKEDAKKTVISSDSEKIPRQHIKVKLIFWDKLIFCYLMMTLHFPASKD